MQLKDCQTDVLDSLSRYLQELNARRERAEKVARFLAEKGEKAELSDYIHQTWEDLHNDKGLPLVRDPYDNLSPPVTSHARTDWIVLSPTSA